MEEDPQLPLERPDARPNYAYQAACEHAFNLSLADRLRLVEDLQTELRAAGFRLEDDAKLDERSQALAVLRAAADYLKLRDGQAPTTTAFRSLPDAVRQGWTVARVTRAWGLWSFAGDALAGANPRPTLKQHSLRDLLVGRKRSYEDYLASVRLWLATKPRTTSTSDYDAWVKEENARRLSGANKLSWKRAETPTAKRPSGRTAPTSASATSTKTEPPLPSYDALSRALRVFWPDILAAARNEQDLKDLPSLTASSKPLTLRGPRLLARADIERLRRSTPSAASNEGFWDDLPAPVATISTAKVWLESDIKAYLAGRRPPRRRPGSLEHLFLDSARLASFLGVTRQALRSKRSDLPSPAGKVAGCWYYLKKDVDRWLAAHPARTARPGRPRSKTASEKPKPSAKSASRRVSSVSSEPSLLRVKKLYLECEV